MLTWLARLPGLSWVDDGYVRIIIRPGKQPIMLLLLGLVGAFLFIRLSTRMIRAQVSWWPGNVSPGGLHLHHELFGVVLMLVTGTLGAGVQTEHPWREVLALLFGIGAGLVLDEFALLLYLQDVYWSEQGRSSIDAVVLATVGVLMLGISASPFGYDKIADDELSARWAVVALIGLNFAFTVVCALKGKLWTTLASVVLPGVGLLGALRVGRPASPWARRRYGDRPDRLRRAVERERRYQHRRRRLLDLIGGAPSRPAPGS